ncbi:hypothetical protein PHYSODRAFT_298800 [Phytophthora sojae]|uniref:Uncharacterized protein n=1 Tax=Phytophthora sojae (strain P6497) TaxID=1094619 RepID=G4Z4J2_PHYSP|nr:hypothetical protein PHYSODRAFT_298800 [Phytophthora sojae]EGZ20836.1 hypothetical protein PHYSODRAFT_298800 [Phytophthora sojae]|eukprot:XP_009523553.1 hypothetical protein PHYSODRAFT_298800 [Phytophthora sojae]
MTVVEHCRYSSFLERVGFVPYPGIWSAYQWSGRRTRVVTDRSLRGIVLSVPKSGDEQRTENALKVHVRGTWTSGRVCGQRKPRRPPRTGVALEEEELHVRGWRTQQEIPSAVHEGYHPHEDQATLTSNTFIIFYIPTLSTTTTAPTPRTPPNSFQPRRTLTTPNKVGYDNWWRSRPTPSDHDARRLPSPRRRDKRRIHSAGSGGGEVPPPAAAAQRDPAAAAAPSAMTTNPTRPALPVPDRTTPEGIAAARTALQRAVEVTRRHSDPHISLGWTGATVQVAGPTQAAPSAGTAPSATVGYGSAPVSTAPPPTQTSILATPTSAPGYGVGWVPLPEAPQAPVGGVPPPQAAPAAPQARWGHQYVASQAAVGGIPPPPMVPVSTERDGLRKGQWSCYRCRADLGTDSSGWRGTAYSDPDVTNPHGHRFIYLVRQAREPLTYLEVTTQAYYGAVTPTPMSTAASSRALRPHGEHVGLAIAHQERREAHSPVLH